MPWAGHHAGRAAVPGADAAGAVGGVAPGGGGRRARDGRRRRASTQPPRGEAAARARPRRGLPVAPLPAGGHPPRLQTPSTNFLKLA